jgi:hypothetical protein
MVTAGSAWLAGTGLAFARNPAFPAPTLPSYSPYIPPPITTTTTNVSPATPPVAAGMEPSVYEAILYGKDIPLFVGGKMLIGGRICEGPYFGGTQTDPTVWFIAYHAMNLVAELFTDTAITQARLRGQEVWNVASGYIATDKLPSGSFDWNPGHIQNHAHAQSIARLGANAAVPYVYGITSSWENIPLKPFGGIVPFPSVLVENSSYGDPADGITRTQALTNILTYMGLYSFEYEIDVSGSDPAWMIASNMTLQDLLRQLRAIFTRWQITYTDKLRIIEPDQFSVAGELTNSNVMRDTLKFKRTDPMSLTREKRYTYIDVDRDYEMNIAVAKEDRYPVPTTDATNAVSIELPIVTTAGQAIADIHNSLYEELAVRSQLEGTVDRTLFGTECGDGVRFADSTVINMTARVMEAVHDFENFTVQIQAGEVLHCDIQGEDQYIDFVGLLLGFEGDMVDESPAAHGAATVIGGANLTSTDPLWGDESLELDASADLDGIYFPPDPDWQLSASNSDEFCVELFVTTTDTTPTDSTLIGVWGGGVPITSWMLYVNTSGNGELTFLAETSGGSPWSAVPVSSGLTWATGTRYYIRVDKDATGKVRLYRGTSGTASMIGSATPSDSSISDESASPAGVLSIGYQHRRGPHMARKIDEVRIPQVPQAVARRKRCRRSGSNRSIPASVTHATTRLHNDPRGRVAYRTPAPSSRAAKSRSRPTSTFTR